MAKTFRSLLSIFLAVLMVASLMVIPSSAASISLNKTSITLTKGYQTTLSVEGTSKTVKWSTGDKSIATVNSKGKVVGKKPGTTYIYAKVGSSTLKCKVKVVAAKITSSSSNVMLDKKGDTKTLTITVKGSHSGLTVGTTKKSVASASWVKPVKWDGNKIKLKLTANGEGTAKIKVYLKNYSSTCYKYINVTVGDTEMNEEQLGSSDDSTSTEKMTILTYPKDTLDVSVGGSQILQVYCTNQSNMKYALSDTTVASVSASVINGKYRNFTVSGLKEGKTILRFYNKNNTKEYVDVTITAGSAEYYQIYDAKPAKKASTDLIITIQESYNKNCYMIVPENYDPAYANTVIAQKFGKYTYYEVYTSVPTINSASADTYHTFVHTNAKYQQGYRYILMPKNNDKAALNTAIAKYNNKFEYYTVYTVSPTKNNSASDLIETWTITDSTTGKAINRYMLVSLYDYDQKRIEEIIDEDKNSSREYKYYTAYNEYPIVNTTTDDVVMYKKDGVWRYMVVPKNDLDILKRNEAIKNDTGVYEAYIMYSTEPTPNTAKGEYVLSAQYGTQRVYVLCTYAQGTDEHDKAWGEIRTKSPVGTNK